MKRNRLVVMLLFLTAAVFLFIDFGNEGEERSFKSLFSKGKKLEYQKIQGEIFGTYYHITYAHPSNVDLKDKISERLMEFNKSLSTYDPYSEISLINKNEQQMISDGYLKTTILKSLEISENTNGAFDITVAPLVNFWGFGFTKRDTERTKLQTSAIDSIMEFVGYQKISLTGENFLKDDARIKLDASAIAKGYGVDVVAQLLSDEGCENFLVEIGGEVVTKGENPRGRNWVIGINKPIESPVPVSNEFQAKVSLTNKAMASSGNYRQFYEVDGKKYSHTIDPKTGYPVTHNLLATSVIANDCMTADAYATAFMVLGTEESLKLANSLEDIEVYLIYQSENGATKVATSKGFKTFLLD